MSRIILPCLLVALALASTASVAQAKDWRVPDDAYQIQAAIDSSTAGTDRVVITDPAEYGALYNAFDLDKDVDVLTDSEDPIKVAPGCSITDPDGTVTGITFQARAAFSRFIDAGSGSVLNCAFVDSGYGRSSAAVQVDAGGVVDACTFALTSGDGLAVEVTGSTQYSVAAVRNNSIDLAVTTAYYEKAAVYLGAAWVSVTGNTITVTGNDAANAVGIDAFDYGNTSTLSNNRISGAGKGIVINASSGGSHVVTGNTLENCVTGLHLYAGGSLDISGNTFANTSCSGSTKGVRVEYSASNSSSTFENNLLYNLGTGIEFATTPSTWTVSHNAFDGSCGSKSNRTFSQTAICDTLEVLFCGDYDEFDPAVLQHWSHRIDSQATAGNNPWGEPVGVFDVGCGWGELARTTTVARDQSALVLEDLTVPEGKSLTLEPGVTLTMNDEDPGEGGSDSELVELIVEGDLVVDGTAQDRVSIGGVSPTAGSWWGIYVEDTGTIAMDYADLRHAESLLTVTSEDTSSVRFCTFADFESYALQIGSGDGMHLLVQENVLYLAGGLAGVLLISDTGGVHVVGNELYGDEPMDYGIGNLFATGAPEIRANYLTGFPASGTIRITGGSPDLTENEIDDSEFGIDVRGGTPRIGIGSASDNVIHDNEEGIMISGGVPVIRNNQIVDNTCWGIWVKDGADPDIGTYSSDGLNTLAGNGYGCILNANSGGSPTVRAEGNFFGDCSGGYPPTCWSGNVEVGGWKCSPPASRRPEIAVVPVDPDLLVRSVRPNPTALGCTVAFRLDGTAGEVTAQVFDLAGRLVRDLFRGSVEPGEHDLAWDGLDDAGRPVRTGMYFVRLSGLGLPSGTVKVLVNR